MFKSFAYYLGVKAAKHAHRTVETLEVSVDFPLYSYAYLNTLFFVVWLLNEPHAYEEGACDYWYSTDLEQVTS